MFHRIKTNCLSKGLIPTRVLGSKQSKADLIAQAPDEVLAQIFSYLDGQSLSRVYSTSKRCKSVVDMMIQGKKQPKILFKIISFMPEEAGKGLVVTGQPFPDELGLSVPFKLKVDFKEKIPKYFKFINTLDMVFVSFPDGEQLGELLEILSKDVVLSGSSVHFLGCDFTTTKASSVKTFLNAVFGEEKPPENETKSKKKVENAEKKKSKKEEKESKTADKKQDPKKEEEEVKTEEKLAVELDNEGSENSELIKRWDPERDGAMAFRMVACTPGPDWDEEVGKSIRPIRTLTIRECVKPFRASCLHGILSAPVPPRNISICASAGLATEDLVEVFRHWVARAPNQDSLNIKIICGDDSSAHSLSIKTQKSILGACKKGLLNKNKKKDGEAKVKNGTLLWAAGEEASEVKFLPSNGEHSPMTIGFPIIYE